MLTAKGYGSEIATVPIAGCPLAPRLNGHLGSTSPTDELIAKQFSSARNPSVLCRTAHVPQSDRRLRTGTSLVLQLTPILFSLRCSSGVHQSNPALWSTRTLNYVLSFYSEFCSPLLGGNPHYATIYRSASPIHCVSAYPCHHCPPLL